MSLFRVLGPVAIGHETSEAPLATRKVRAALAALLLNAGHWISRSKLTAFIWDEPPGSADANLRTYLTALRRTLHSLDPELDQRLETLRGEGHRIRVWADEVDCHRFVSLGERGAQELREKRPDRATTTLAAALRLWRGPVGADLPDTAPFREHAERLRRRQIAAREDFCEARIRIGEAPLVVNDLYDLVAEEPMSDRPVALLMQALQGMGEAAAALSEYHRYRSYLADELGVGPSPGLESSYIRILRGEHHDVQ